MKFKKPEKKYRVQVIQVGTDEECQRALAEARRYIFARLVEKIHKEKVATCAGGSICKGIN